MWVSLCPTLRRGRNSLLVEDVPPAVEADGVVGGGDAFVDDRMVPAQVVVGDALLLHHVLDGVQPAEAVEDVAAELGVVLPGVDVCVVERFVEVGCGDVGVGQEKVGGGACPSFLDEREETEGVVGVAERLQRAVDGGLGFRTEPVVAPFLFLWSLVGGAVVSRGSWFLLS